MLESVGDDSVVFNQENIHKIITIAKERVSNDKEPENIKKPEKKTESTPEKT